MHTEKQAKELWCPMVRHQGDGGASFNRSRYNSNPINADTDKTAERHQGTFGCHCIASKCAMWRWTDSPGLVSRGYCGLAGKP